jgi:predicted glutamine amidotransferase
MSAILGILADSRVDTEASLRGAVSRSDPHRWAVALDVVGECTLYKTHLPSSDIALSISRHVFIGRSSIRADARSGLAAAHPFRSGKWMFAHDGVIHDAAALRRRISPERTRQLEGDTTSELLFAYLLGWLDALEPSDVALGRATSMIAREVHGSVTFVLSDGSSMDAYRHGRPLFLLQRDDAVLFASEPITSDAWVPLSNGVLVRADRDPPAWRFLVESSLVDSRPELPFTD